MSSLLCSGQAWGLVEMGTVGLWALTPPCGLCTPLPGHGSVTRRRLSLGPPVSSAGAAGASAPRSRQSGPGRQGVCSRARTPHPAALPSGWPGEESRAACRPVAAGCCRGQRSQAEPAACRGLRWRSDDTCSPEGEVFLPSAPTCFQTFRGARGGKVNQRCFSVCVFSSFFWFLVACWALQPGHWV